MSNQQLKYIQFHILNSAIIYKQQTKPNNGINDKFCFQDHTAKHTKEIKKIHIGILCLNKLKPLSYFKESAIGNASIVSL